jgi:hypothetical protein
MNDSMKHADWKLIPEYMHGGIRRYVEEGKQPGDFLTAVICNDLLRSVERADDTNIRLLARYVMFFYNYTPHDCWGSEDKVKAWIAKGGLEGKVRPYYSDDEECVPGN